MEFWFKSISSQGNRKIQKVALKIIHGQQYNSDLSACTYFGLQKLSVRRQEISTRFAVNLYKSNRCNEFFIPARRNVNTRSDEPLVLEEKSNTRRCYNAPHNYLARLVNKNKARILRSRKWLCNTFSLGTSLSVTCGLLGQGPVFCFVQSVCT